MNPQVSPVGPYYGLHRPLVHGLPGRAGRAHFRPSKIPSLKFKPDFFRRANHSSIQHRPLPNTCGIRSPTIASLCHKVNLQQQQQQQALWSIITLRKIILESARRIHIALSFLMRTILMRFVREEENETENLCILSV